MEIKECDQVNLTVIKKTDLGFVVLINNSLNGLLYENDIYEPVEVGMNKIGFIKKLASNKGFLQTKKKLALTCLIKHHLKQ